MREPVWRRLPLVLLSVGMLFGGLGPVPIVHAVMPAPVITALANGTVHTANPDLAWIAVTGASMYRVQVATTPTFTTTIYQDDTVATRHIPSVDLDPGILYWRVAALSGGVPQTWASGSFQKSATLATPTLLSPANGTVVDYPHPAVLHWSPVSRAGGYDLQIQGSSTINDQPIRLASTSFAVQLADEPISWRVRAVSTNGRSVGPWSTPWSAAAAWGDVPEIESPPDGGYPIRDAYLAWDPIAGARRYEVQVTPVPADWSSVRTVEASTVLPVYEFLDPNSLGGGAYAWRVRGVDVNGWAAPWSPVRTFEIELSHPPTLLAPADGSATSAYPILRWTPVVRAAHYLVDVSTDATFQAGTQTVRTTEPELVASIDSPYALHLEAGRNYFWRVRAIDDPGGRLASEPSDVGSFTFAPPPIELVSPDYQASVSVPTFAWEGGWGPTYRLSIRTRDGELVYQGTTESTTHTPVSLLPTGDLLWRVEAMTWDGRVANASEWRLVLIRPVDAVEGPPIITLPAGTSGWIPPVVTWTPVIGAATYDVRATCDRCGAFNAVPLVYPAFTFEGPWLGNQRFDFTVVAYDGTGAVVGESDPSHFFLTSPPYATPLPIDGCADPCVVTDTPRLAWTPVPGADHYDVAIHRAGETVGGLEVAYSTYATTVRLPADLLDRSYTWRVRSCAANRCTTLPPTPSVQGAFTKAVPRPVATDPHDGAVLTDLVTLAWDDWLDATDPSGRHQSEAYSYGAANGLRRTFATSEPEITWAPTVEYEVDSGHRGVVVGESRTVAIRRPAPVLLAPASGASLAFVQALEWEPRAFAQTYEVELYRGDGTDLSAANLVTRALPGHRLAALNINELGAGTYAWRVRAFMGDIGYSDWSEIRKFEVGPSAVTMVAPMHGQTLPASSVTLEWNALDRAESYRVDLSQSATFSSISESVVTSQARWIPTVSLGPGAWYWRVTPLSTSALPLAAPATQSFLVATPPPPPNPSPSPTPTPNPTPTPVVRLAGSDRYATAAAISAASFEAGVPVVYIATGSSFPDALAAGPLAARDRAPVLLVSRSTVPSATLTELNRLKPRKIVVLGGTSVIGSAVTTALSKVAPVSRLAGADRYETAAKLSATFPQGAPVAYIAVGTNFPDALAGVPATRGRGPLLLVSPRGVPASVARELSRLKPKSIVILGGSAVVSAATAAALDAFTTGPVLRRSGANRYETAVAVSKAAFSTASVAYIAVGTNFPDALAGGSPAAIKGVPLLLVARDSVPAAVVAELHRLGVDRVVILGGAVSVSASVAADLEALLD